MAYLYFGEQRRQNFACRPSTVRRENKRAREERVGDNNARVVPTPEENNGPLKDQTGKDNARAPARAFTPKTMRWNSTCTRALNAKRKRFRFLLLARGAPTKNVHTYIYIYTCRKFENGCESRCIK